MVAGKSGSERDARKALLTWLRALHRVRRFDLVARIASAAAGRQCRVAGQQEMAVRFDKVLHVVI